MSSSKVYKKGEGSDGRQAEQRELWRRIKAFAVGLLLAPIGSPHGMRCILVSPGSSGYKISMLGRQAGRIFWGITKQIEGMGGRAEDMC